MQLRMADRLIYTLFDAVSRRSVLPTLERMAERQTWSREALARYSQDRLGELVEHARERVPFYRSLDPFDAESFERTPFLTKDLLRTETSRLRLPSLSGPMRTTTSGGSTGTPVAVHLDRDTLDAQSAATLRHQFWMGLDLVTRHLLLWGPPPSQLSYHKLGGRLRGLLLRRRTVPTHVLDAGSMAEADRILRSWRPRQVIGYSQALYALALRGTEIEAPPHAVVAAAEMLFPHQRSVIEQHFRAPVFERYGCNEFSAMAHDCERGRLHVNSDRIWLEIIRPDGSRAGPGELGEAVISDLDNYGMPILRFRTGDVVERGTDCDCGLPFPTLGPIHGRTQDMIPGAGGAPISPRRLAEELSRVPGYLEHQLVIDDGRPVTLRVRSTSAATASDYGAIVVEVLGSEPEVSINDEIERWPSGKIRPVLRY